MSESINTLQTSEEFQDQSRARYDLSEAELSEINSKLVALADENLSEPGIGVVWIRPDHPYANFVRTHEASYFPEVADVDEDDEEGTMFAALVDTRDASRRVVHGMTIMRPHSEPKPGNSPTGLYTVDSLIERGNFSAEEFYDYYKKQGVDLTKSISVETTFIIGERPESLNGLGTAELSYLALFQMVENSGAELEKADVFLTVNNRAISSLNRVGVNFEPLMGLDVLDTEESELGIESKPVAIKFDEASANIFGNSSLRIPQVTV